MYASFDLHAQVLYTHAWGAAGVRSLIGMWKTVISEHPSRKHLQGLKTASQPCLLSHSGASTAKAATSFLMAMSENKFWGRNHLSFKYGIIEASYPGPGVKYVFENWKEPCGITVFLTMVTASTPRCTLAQNFIRSLLTQVTFAFGSEVHSPIADKLSTQIPDFLQVLDNDTGVFGNWAWQSRILVYSPSHLPITANSSLPRLWTYS